MKFSVAVEIRAPEGAEEVLWAWVEFVGVGREMVAGRPVRRRSVARGQSIWRGDVSILFGGNGVDGTGRDGWAQEQATRRIHPSPPVPTKGNVLRGTTYLPRPLECFQVDELPRYSLVGQIGFILLQQPAARFRVLGLGHRVFDVGFFETIERNYDAVDFGEGVVKVPLGSAGGKLDFLGPES